MIRPKLINMNILQVNQYYLQVQVKKEKVYLFTIEKNIWKTNKNDQGDKQKVAAEKPKQIITNDQNGENFF